MKLTSALASAPRDTEAGHSARSLFGGHRTLIRGVRRPFGARSLAEVIMAIRRAVAAACLFLLSSSSALLVFARPRPAGGGWVSGGARGAAEAKLGDLDRRGGLGVDHAPPSGRRGPPDAAGPVGRDPPRDHLGPAAPLAPRVQRLDGEPAIGSDQHRPAATVGQAGHALAEEGHGPCRRSGVARPQRAVDHQPALALAAELSCLGLRPAKAHENRAGLRDREPAASEKWPAPPSFLVRDANLPAIGTR